MRHSTPRLASSWRVLLAGAVLAGCAIACSDGTSTGPTAPSRETFPSAGASINSPRRAAPRAVPVRAGNDGSIEIWGGVGVALTVDSTGAHLQFDCARGAMPPLSLLAGTRFAVAGTWEFEYPVVRSDFPPPLPARYEGTIQGETMILTATITATAAGPPQVAGPFTLVRGQFARLRMCNAQGGR